MSKSYEDSILDRIESEADDCKHCEYASESNCRNQCMRIETVVNPVVAAHMKGKR